jgi:hypothetical protein
VTTQVTVVETPTYLVRASRIMTSAEMNSVVEFVSRTPEAGDVIKGSRGLRKTRVALSGRGKSGGARVIYWYYNEGFPAVLLWPSPRMKQKILQRCSWQPWQNMRKPCATISGDRNEKVQL